VRTPDCSDLNREVVQARWREFNVGQKPAKRGTTFCGLPWVLAQHLVLAML
jgi:hypothetical protein